MLLPCQGAGVGVGSPFSYVSLPQTLVQPSTLQGMRPYMPRDGLQGKSE